VTLHEFAHQLDQEDGAADGAPLLGKRAVYAAWARVFGEEFAQLVEDVDKHRNIDIDAYGATSPAEFFAVVTEVFFEKPEPLNADTRSSASSSLSSTARISRRTLQRRPRKDSAIRGRTAQRALRA
jgi:Mlc titration factor MtfA (ptsG expression regulator)